MEIFEVSSNIGEVWDFMAQRWENFQHLKHYLKIMFENCTLDNTFCTFLFIRLTSNILAKLWDTFSVGICYGLLVSR